MAQQEATPLERVRRLGVKSAPIIDLVSVAYSRRESDVEQAETMARGMLSRYRTVQGLGEMSTAEVSELTGLDSFEVLRCQALIELGRRVAQAGKGPITSIERPEDVAELLSHLLSEKREHFVAILLDAKSAIMRVAYVHIGTLTMSVVGPREVFREALRDGANSIVVAHNHPSGDPQPSPEDIEVTRQLVEVGKLLDVPVLDHVILGERGFSSLRRLGVIE